MLVEVHLSAKNEINFKRHIETLGKIIKLWYFNERNVKTTHIDRKEWYYCLESQTLEYHKECGCPRSGTYLG
jgi:hypothetical protein